MKKIAVPIQPSTTPSQQHSMLEHRRSPSMKRLTTPVLAFTPFSNQVLNTTKPVNVSNDDDNYTNNNLNASLVHAKVNNGGPPKPINYKNGRKIEPMFFSFATYYRHKEHLPQHYNSLVQYLEDTEVKYHNDNLHENSPIGFPTRAQLLKERVYHLPILNDTPVEKARYRRKLEEKQQSIVTSRKKFDFTTHDNFSAHYFLTGARFNRNDTIDSKILNKYGVFVNRHKPELVYIKSPKKALQNFEEDLEKLTNPQNHTQVKRYRSKSVQVLPKEFPRAMAPTSQSTTNPTKIVIERPKTTADPTKLHHLGTKFYFRDRWNKGWLQQEGTTTKPDDFEHQFAATQEASKKPSKSKQEITAVHTACLHNEIPCECYFRETDDILSERDVVEYTYPKMPIHA